MSDTKMSMNDQWIAVLNFGILVASSIIFFYFYVISVRPKALEKVMGTKSWRVCAIYRFISCTLMLVAAGNYMVYYFYPLPQIPTNIIPHKFPFPYWISVTIATTLAIPSVYLIWRGVTDAGEETALPKPEHEMYGGIYNVIRHPQCLGEIPLWWTIAFFLHSPFLVAFSFLYIPVWIVMCKAEEADLILRFGDKYGDYQNRVGFMIPESLDKKGA